VDNLGSNGSGKPTQDAATRDVIQFIEAQLADFVIHVSLLLV
jgi:hypothetical protein